MIAKYLMIGLIAVLLMVACSERDTSNDKALLEEVKRPLDKAEQVQDVLDKAAEERRKQIEQQTQ